MSLNPSRLILSALESMVSSKAAAGEIVPEAITKLLDADKKCAEKYEAKNAAAQANEASAEQANELCAAAVADPFNQEKLAEALMAVDNSGTVCKAFLTADIAYRQATTGFNAAFATAETLPEVIAIMDQVAPVCPGCNRRHAPHGDLGSLVERIASSGIGLTIMEVGPDGIRETSIDRLVAMLNGGENNAAPADGADENNDGATADPVPGFSQAFADPEATGDFNVTVTPDSGNPAKDGEDLDAN